MPSQVLGFKSPMQVISKYFPDFNTTAHLVPKIFSHVFCSYSLSNRGKLDPRALKCVVIGYLPLKRGINVICWQGNSVSEDVPFVEQESKFPSSLSSGGDTIHGRTRTYNCWNSNLLPHHHLSQTLQIILLLLILPQSETPISNPLMSFCGLKFYPRRLENSEGSTNETLLWQEVRISIAHNPMQHNRTKHWS